MVVIPHEDDEINVAGSTIHGAILEGVHVICVFSTWGDDLYTPDIRRREAVKALKTLGVKEDDVIFLGYPDGGRGRGQKVGPIDRGVRRSIYVFA